MEAVMGAGGALRDLRSVVRLRQTDTVVNGSYIQLDSTRSAIFSTRPTSLHFEQAKQPRPKAVTPCWTGHRMRLAPEVIFPASNGHWGQKEGEIRGK